MYAVGGALGTSSVDRLTKAQEKLSKTELKDLEDMQMLLKPAGNNKNLMIEMEKHLKGEGAVIPQYAVIKKNFTSGLETLNQSPGGLFAPGVSIGPIVEYQRRLKKVLLSEVSVQVPKLEFDEKTVYDQSLKIQPREEKK